jgi:hypothetical protein
MDFFRARVTPDETRKFAKLVSAADTSSKVQALEMVLFKLNDDELFSIGVTQTRQPDGLDWSVSWTSGGKQAQVVRDALNLAGVRYYGSLGHGHGGWYVPRDQFFSARAALFDSPQVRTLGIDVVTPGFELH